MDKKIVRQFVAIFLSSLILLSGSVKLNYLVKAEYRNISNTKVIELGNNYQDEFTKNIRSRKYKFVVKESGTV